MPANTKYLTPSFSQRFAKISAGIIGGYLVSMSFHLAIASWVNHINVIITMTFTGFIVWVTLMVLAFLAENGWKAWLLYLGLTLLFAVVIFIGKTYNPYFIL